ncbi:MAG: hypothetical protein ACOCQP_01970 [Lentisphaeria bacterium]
MNSPLNNEFCLTPEALNWTAKHARNRAEGVASITVNGRDLLNNCTFYIDELNRDNGIVDSFNCKHKANCALIESSGFFPFGGEPGFQQKWKYGQNHVQISFDLQWPQDMAIKRRFGLGSCHLPGSWKRFYMVPPAYHWNEGAVPQWFDLPEPQEKAIMVGHWHRPPLTLVFENNSGDQIEIGTGPDLWRWEKAFNAAPESGSYKIFLSSSGIELIREPLMTCLPFKPSGRNYRFKWYIAWSPVSQKAWNKEADFTIIPGSDKSFTDIENSGSLGEGRSYLLDFTLTEWTAQCRAYSTQPDYIRGLADHDICWCSQPVKNSAKKTIRRIKHRLPPGRIIVKGLTPGLCWHPSHLNRNHPDGLPHWDINDILDFSLWTSHHLGDAWEIYRAPDSSGFSPLPSVRGLFQPG